MYKLSIIDKVSIILVIIGAINWGLVGLFNFDLIFYLFRNMMALGKIIYILIGVAGIDMLLLYIKAKQQNHIER